jgi:AcrR family transcriptional regulator
MGNQLRTRLQIVSALDELMAHMPIEKVKVVKICKLAGVSRTTFYEYFKDVFEVVTWMWDHIMDDALYPIGITIDNTEGHVRSFKALQQHRDFFYNAFKSKAYNSAFEYGSRKVKHILTKNAERHLDRSFTSDELLRIDFYNYGAAGMTRQWVVSGMIETPEKITAILDEETPGFFADLLNQTDPV